MTEILERTGYDYRLAPPQGLLARTIEVARAALRGTPQLPKDVEERIQFVRELPANEIDRRLALLVDADVDRKVDGKLPTPLVKEIAETARALIDKFPPEAHTDKSLAALARAADDTGEQEFLAAALELAEQQQIHGISNPDFMPALRLAANTEMAFRDALAKIRTQQTEIIGAVREKGHVTFESDTSNHVPLGPSYEWLFDETNTPSTAQYKDGYPKQD